MISEYWGEFLVSPVPLEMSLNACSHRCAYCFSLLNQPARQADPGKIMRLLAERDTRQTLTAHLLREGYPVVVSNRDDPFATSNYKQALPILETMAGLDIPVAIQTKGGKGVTDALRFLKPAVWYVSIGMLDDARRKAIEPSAPSIDSRFDLIREVTAAGHRVVIGLNPCVPEWLPGDDVERLLERGRDAGAEGVWIEILHLNYRQEAKLTERERGALTQPLIDRARKKGADVTQWATLTRAYDACGELGLPFYSGGQPLPSDFWRPFRELYPRTYPTMQDFVNWCYANLEDGALIDFATFAAVMAEHAPPAGTWPIDGYLGNKAHNLWWTKQVPPQMTYTDLLKILWSETDLGTSPARMLCFVIPVEERADGPVMWTDAEGLPLLAFSSQMFDGVYAPAGGRIASAPTSCRRARSSDLRLSMPKSVLNGTQKSGANAISHG